MKICDFCCSEKLIGFSNNFEALSIKSSLNTRIIVDVLFFLDALVDKHPRIKAWLLKCKHKICTSCFKLGALKII